MRCHDAHIVVLHAIDVVLSDERGDKEKGGHMRDM